MLRRILRIGNLEDFPDAAAEGDSERIGTRKSGGIPVELCES